MIAYIKGKLTSIQEDGVIIEAGGIGYDIKCSDPFTFENHLNQEVTIHTFHHVREDASLLYGFKNEDEKYLFMKLISVSGIGPKGALAIQGSAHMNEFAGAIEQEDVTFLTKLPGVGKKTARQMILDLKGQLQTYLSVSGASSAMPSNDIEPSASALSEAQEALKALGYKENEIQSVLPQLRLENHLKADEMIKKALALLVKN